MRLLSVRSEFLLSNATGFEMFYRGRRKVVDFHNLAGMTDWRSLPLAQRAVADAKARGDFTERMARPLAVPGRDRVPQRADGGIGAGEIASGNFGRAQGRHLAHRISRLDQEAADLHEESFHDVGRDRYRSLRHSGEGLRVGEDVGAKRREE